jgi:hypothetical protein
MLALAPIWMENLCTAGQSICQDWIQVVLKLLRLVMHVLCLNAVALLCGNNALRFGVEKVMGRENHHFQRETVNEEECHSLGCRKRESFAAINWRHNSMKSGSGPVVLLHFPLHKSDG